MYDCEAIRLVWCSDWVSQYDSYDKFEKYGLGVVLFVDGEMVSGASSYYGYIGGIEIEIDTHKDHRRKGYASICGANLIIECLKRNLYPCWEFIKWKKRKFIRFIHRNFSENVMEMIHS